MSKESAKLPFGKLDPQVAQHVAHRSGNGDYLNKFILIVMFIIFLRFFTLVPHDFGRDNAPLLDNVEFIKKKTEMLDNLLEIEIAYSLLKTDSDDTMTPIESHYKKLKAEIAPLAKDTEEYKMLLEYTRNTHATTHTQYTLDVEQVSFVCTSQQFFFSK